MSRSRIASIENILGEQLSYMEREYDFPHVDTPYGWPIALAQLVQDEYGEEAFNLLLDGMTDALELRE